MMANTSNCQYLFEQRFAGGNLHEGKDEFEEGEGDTGRGGGPVAKSVFGLLWAARFFLICSASKRSAGVPCRSPLVSFLYAYPTAIALHCAQNHSEIHKHCIGRWTPSQSKVLLRITRKEMHVELPVLQQTCLE